MELRDVLRDEHALDVVPGTVADAVASVDCALTVRTEIRAPLTVSGACGCRQRLAGLIGARQATEIASTRCRAGDEEPSRALGWLLCESLIDENRRQRSEHEQDDEATHAMHYTPPDAHKIRLDANLEHDQRVGYTANPLTGRHA